MRFSECDTLTLPLVNMYGPLLILTVSCEMGKQRLTVPWNVPCNT